MRLLSLICILFCFALPVHSSETIRVSLADSRKSVLLESKDGLQFGGASSDAPKKQVTIRAGELKTRTTRVRSKDGVVRVNGKRYRGIIEIRKKTNGTLLVINELDLESYLKGVVSAEVPNGWSPEALKAQAIASRTYALYQKREAGGRAYHMLSSVNSQVYNGCDSERARTTKAIEETRGVVIVYQGNLIPAFYHSSCGGHTEDASELWGFDEPYLKGVDCDCQEISSFGLWERRISTSTLLRALSRIGYRLGDIGEMRIGRITNAGRVKTISFISAGKSGFVVDAEPLRASLGNSLIPSVFYEVEVMGAEVVFSGRGHGHGVGLCQWGAQEMALRGLDYRAILSHYYPGTSLVNNE